MVSPFHGVLVAVHVLRVSLDAFTAPFMAVFSDNEEMLTLVVATYEGMNLVLGCGLWRPE